MNCCYSHNNFINDGTSFSLNWENNFWKSEEGSELTFLLSLSKAFLILEISLSSCLHSNLFWCNVNLILSGDVNLTGAFNLAGAVKTNFLKFTSILNIMFSAWQLLHIFSDGKTNNLQLLDVKTHLDAMVAANRCFEIKNNQIF